MATITAFIRTTQKKSTKTNVRFRLRDGRNVQIFHASEIEVNPLIWDAKEQKIKSKAMCNPSDRLDLDMKVAARKMLISSIYSELKDKTDASSQWLEKSIDEKLNPEKHKDASPELVDVFDAFIEKHSISDVRKKNFRVVARSLRRFETFEKIDTTNYTLTFDNFTSETLRRIEAFLRSEHQYVSTFPDLYTKLEKSRLSHPRGQNTLNGMMVKIRTFVLWAIREELTNKNPFTNFKIEECVYGTPYYITIDERNELFNFDLSTHPQLAIQRDIFVFQCFVGCRVGDLIGMTRDNISGGFLEYIQLKTKDDSPKTVRVPLNCKAKEIVERYKDCEDRLLPFISEQQYNRALKEIFTIVGLTRKVTVLNPTTRKEERLPLNEVASSHLARRTFIGNLYKQVKDPNLVGALSGHKEGSKAFARYREIDDAMKIELVNLLD